MNKEDVLELEDIGINFSSKLIVHNDEVNTFECVDICYHTPQQAEQCAMIIHNKGKTVVKSGDLDDLRIMKYGLTDRGLSVTIEE
jgi:ATP-dependent Clp protease adaptor protein ClpS